MKAVRAFESASGYIHYRSAFRFCAFILKLSQSKNLTFDVKKVFERERAPQDPLMGTFVLTPEPKTKRVKIPKHKIIKTPKKVKGKKRDISEVEIK